VPVGKDVLLTSRTTGDLVDDAHLAALALRLDAGVATFDADFARFSAVTSSRPGDPA
jgi:predicted nucleic acid-binding protein